MRKELEKLQAITNRHQETNQLGVLQGVMRHLNEELKRLITKAIEMDVRL